MKDPVETFPSEVLSPLIALFNTKELAILSAVCRFWRIQIQTDIIINRILDLTGLGRDLSQDQTIQLVKRLASLSSFPKNQIRLPLKPFWETVEEALKKENGPAFVQSTSVKFASLLSAITLATNRELSELQLLGPVGKSKDSLAFAVAEAIIEGVFALKRSMKILDKGLCPYLWNFKGRRISSCFRATCRTDPKVHGIWNLFSPSSNRPLNLQAAH